MPILLPGRRSANEKSTVSNRRFFVCAEFQDLISGFSDTFRLVPTIPKTVADKVESPCFAAFFGEFAGLRDVRKFTQLAKTDEQFVDTGIGPVFGDLALEQGAQFGKLGPFLRQFLFGAAQFFVCRRVEKQIVTAHVTNVFLHFTPDFRNLRFRRCHAREQGAEPGLQSRPLVVVTIINLHALTRVLADVFCPAPLDEPPPAVEHPAGHVYFMQDDPRTVVLAVLERDIYPMFYLQFPFGTGEVFGHLHPVVDSLPCHRYAVLQVSISVCRASHSRTLIMLYSEVTTAVRSLICVKRVLS